MKYLKHIALFLMLGVMLFVGARFVVFKTAIKLQKQEFRQVVLKQQHKTFKQVVVSAKDLYKDVNGLEWKENNKEVVIKNVYHEVLSVTKQGNTYIINIIEDKMENELFENFFEANGSGKYLADHLLLVFAMNFVVPQQEQIKQLAESKAEHNTIHKQKHPSGFYSKTIKPPFSIYNLV